jgi:hypothetical protein
MTACDPFFNDSVQLTIIKINNIQLFVLICISIQCLAIISNE